MSWRSWSMCSLTQFGLYLMGMRLFYTRVSSTTNWRLWNYWWTPWVSIRIFSNPKILMTIRNTILFFAVMLKQNKACFIVFTQLIIYCWIPICVIVVYYLCMNLLTVLGMYNINKKFENIENLHCWFFSEKIYSRVARIWKLN